MYLNKKQQTAMILIMLNLMVGGFYFPVWWVSSSFPPCGGAGVPFDAFMIKNHVYTCEFLEVPARLNRCLQPKLLKFVFHRRYNKNRSPFLLYGWLSNVSVQFCVCTLISWVHTHFCCVVWQARLQLRGSVGGCAAVGADMNTLEYTTNIATRSRSLLLLTCVLQNGRWSPRCTEGTPFKGC